MLIGFSVFAGLAMAHHSVAGYDSKKEISLRGVVAEYNWRNPHVFLTWDVKDESGKLVQWTGELSSPTTMMQLGMSKNSLKPGDEVIITANPSLTGNPLGLIRKITTADGKVIVDKLTPQ
jgi:hypothetical protein